MTHQSAALRRGQAKASLSPPSGRKPSSRYSYVKGAEKAEEAYVKKKRVRERGRAEPSETVSPRQDGVSARV